NSALLGVAQLRLTLSRDRQGSIVLMAIVVCAIVMGLLLTVEQLHLSSAKLSKGGQSGSEFDSLVSTINNLIGSASSCSTNLNGQVFNPSSSAKSQIKLTDNGKTMIAGKGLQLSGYMVTGFYLTSPGIISGGYYNATLTLTAQKDAGQYEGNRDLQHTFFL